MKLEKINPFIKARYEHGYRTARKFARDIEISATVYWSWENGNVACPRGGSLYIFHKMCKAFEWTDSEGAENISNMYQWSKNPDIEIVKPNWDDYKHIKPHLGKEVPTCTLDVINMDNPLIKWRAENNLTRYEASEFIGILSTEYALIEDGVFKPSSDVLKKITEATGLSLTQIAKIYCPLPDEAREEYAKANANLKSTTVKDIVEDMQTPEYKAMVEEAVEKVDEIMDSDSRSSLDKMMASESPFKGVYDSVRRQREELESTSSMVAHSEAQIILDVIYGKVTLEEYRKIETILGR